MRRNDSRFAARTVRRWGLPAITMVLLAIAALSCRGQKPSPDETYVPVPVNPSPVPRAVRHLPDQAFHVEWVGNDAPKVMKAGAASTVTVTFKNASLLPWPDPDSTSYEPPQAGAVRLTCRWWPASSPTPLAWGSRADLERLLQPGQTATLSLAVTAPTAPGDYRLQFDLVQEMAAYFEDKGAARLIVPVQVR